jgi:hypothetical protein
MITFAALVLSSVAVLAADVPTVNWTKLSPANSPTARGYTAMAYDAVSRQIVLFGGYDGSKYLNDTWTFDGTTWTKVNTPTAPPPRSNMGMAFDRVSRQVVIFGGFNGTQHLGDTWTFDGSTMTWTQQHPTISPKGASGPMLFTDPVSGWVDEYGGFDGQFFQLNTFRWTGTDWKRVRTSNSATARGNAVAATDGKTKTTVLFDGIGDVNPYNTWTFDGSNWTEQTPAQQPPSRYGSPGAFDPRLGAVIVFGGGEGGPELNDTWAWTGTAWKQLSPAQSPPGREGYGMAYDPAIGHIVIFGGQGLSTLLADTWELTQ